MTDFAVKVQKTQARFKKLKDPKQPRLGIGEFFLLIDITALQKDIYIPFSIASGKKPTGFIYQIEGTGQGDIATTHISWTGVGVTQITLGTIVYCKIPAGKIATFRILIEMRGKTPEEYRIVINQINFKHTPTDARYKKLSQDIGTKSLKFS
jgi:hypothetical protein